MGIDAFGPDGPWLHPFTAAVSDAWDFLQSLKKTGGKTVVARLVRGKKMRTTQGLYDEFAAAMQFPYYFGENGNAFDECLTDLEWLSADAYMILVSDSDQWLAAEPAHHLSVLFQTLVRVGREWGKPVSGEFARPARPFHVFLQCTSAEEQSLGKKLKAAGVAFTPIT